MNLLICLVVVQLFISVASLTNEVQDGDPAVVGGVTTTEYIEDGTAIKTRTVINNTDADPNTQTIIYYSGTTENVVATSTVGYIDANSNLATKVYYTGAVANGDVDKVEETSANGLTVTTYSDLPPTIKVKEVTVNDATPPTLTTTINYDATGEVIVNTEVENTVDNTYTKEYPAESSEHGGKKEYCTGTKADPTFNYVEVTDKDSSLKVTTYSDITLLASSKVKEVTVDDATNPTLKTTINYDTNGSTILSTEIVSYATDGTVVTTEIEDTAATTYTKEYPAEALVHGGKKEYYTGTKAEHTISYVEVTKVDDPLVVTTYRDTTIEDSNKVKEVTVNDATNPTLTTTINYDATGEAIASTEVEDITANTYTIEYPPTDVDGGIKECYTGTSTNHTIAYIEVPTVDLLNITVYADTNKTLIEKEITKDNETNVTTSITYDKNNHSIIISTAVENVTANTYIVAYEPTTTEGPIVEHYNGVAENHTFIYSSVTSLDLLNVTIYKDNEKTKKYSETIYNNATVPTNTTIQYYDDTSNNVVIKKNIKTVADNGNIITEYYVLNESTLILNETYIKDVDSNTLAKTPLPLANGTRITKVYKLNDTTEDLILKIYVSPIVNDSVTTETYVVSSDYQEQLFLTSIEDIVTHEVNQTTAPVDGIYNVTMINAANEILSKEVHNTVENFIKYYTSDDRLYREDQFTSEDNLSKVTYYNEDLSRKVTTYNEDGTIKSTDEFKAPSDTDNKTTNSDSDTTDPEESVDEPATTAPTPTEKSAGLKKEYGMCSMIVVGLLYHLLY